MHDANESPALVGPCRCGGYGIVLTGENQRLTGRCHVPLSGPLNPTRPEGESADEHIEGYGTIRSNAPQDSPSGEDEVSRDMGSYADVSLLFDTLHWPLEHREKAMDEAYRRMRKMRSLLTEEEHPFPWRVEHDWMLEIRDADGRLVVKGAPLDPEHQLYRIAYVIEDHPSTPTEEKNDG